MSKLPLLVHLFQITASGVRFCLLVQNSKLKGPRKPARKLGSRVRRPSSPSIQKAGSRPAEYPRRRCRESKFSTNRYSQGRKDTESQKPQFTATQLGAFFGISPEAVRRILKSNWRPSSEEQIDRAERWQRRRERIAAEVQSRSLFQKSSAALRPSRRRMISTQRYTENPN